MPTKYAHIKGHATHYYYAGRTTLPDVVPDFSRGRTIVFVHAAGSNANTWHNQLNHFSAGHSPIAPDLPGHGRSEGVDGLPSIRHYADFVAAFLDGLGIKSAVIAGRSMGGAIAMEMALRHDERVDGLVLIATAAKFNIADRLPGLEAVTKGRAPQAFTTDGYSPKTAQSSFDVIRQGWMEQVKTDPRVRYTDMVACSEFDVRDEIVRIKKPALVIAGADDTIATPSDAEFIAKQIPGARLEIIAEAGHYVPTEKPHDVCSRIEAFVASL